MKPERALRSLDALASDTFAPLNELREIMIDVVTTAFIEGYETRAKEDDPKLLQPVSKNWWPW